MARARGDAGAARGHAPTGHHDDHRGRVRPARARGRGGARPAGAARPARLPAGPGRPCVGRQPALHPHRRVRQGGRVRALRRVHARPRGADRRQVRRLAEGRARDRDQHGTVRGARVGRRSDRADVGDQAAGRPGRRARPRRRAQPRSRRPPAQPQERARGGGERHQVHRVWLLRAGVPVAEPHYDTAAADRPAPRDGPPARRLARPRRVAEAIRVRRRARRAPSTARA